MDTPEVVTQSEWLEARKALLAKEKEVTRLRDELSAERRRLPMVEIEKDYRFVGADGEVGLADLFEGRSQLLIYHFMWLDRRGRGLPVVLVPGRQHRRRPPSARARHDARARRARPVRGHRRLPQAHGLGHPDGTRRSAATSTTTSTSRPTATWRRSNTTIAARPTSSGRTRRGRTGRASSPARARSCARATASSTPTPRTRARGDILIGTYNWLDLTARGRQEKWEQPPGRNDGSSGMQWLRRHDEYPASSARAAG